MLNMWIINISYWADDYLETFIFPIQIYDFGGMFIAFPAGNLGNQTFKKK